MNKTDEKRQLDRELADLPAGDLQPELDSMLLQDIHPIKILFSVQISRTLPRH
jgi:hypothetical protein